MSHESIIEEANATRANLRELCTQTNELIATYQRSIAVCECRIEKDQIGLDAARRTLGDAEKRISDIDALRR